jgi:hypothetical protein
MLFRHEPSGVGISEFHHPNSNNDAANDKGKFRYLQEDKIARKLK